MVAVTSPPARQVYRRRRLAVLAVVGFVVLTLAFSLSRLSGAEAAGVPQPPRIHVVQPGDTLWSIAAEEAAADQDVRALVDEIAARNGGAAVQVGQRLLLP